MLKLEKIKMNKKGFAIAFSWIFSIMVGVIIFLSLVYFAVQHTDLFGRLSAQVAVEELDIAFSSYKSSLIGTSLNFGKNIELKFNCIEGIGEKMYVNNKGGKTLKGKIIFSPEIMDSNEFFLWTMDWNVPFTVTNFIFLKNNPKFHLVRIPDALSAKIPENIVIDDDSGEVIQFRSLPPTVFTCTNTEKEIFWAFDPVLEEYYGVICIGGRQFQFIGDAMIFAAIFSDDDNFGCLYNQAVQKNEDMKKIYAEKVKYLECNPNSVNSDFVEALNFRDIREESINNFITLKRANDNLVRRGICEPIY